MEVTSDIRSCRYPDHHFDVVSLWHVFEHLPNPEEILREIARILKPHGLLVIEVPNLSSWQFKISRGTWIHLDSPRHFFHYSPYNLNKILGSHGFHVRSLRTLSWEFGPFGMLQSLLNVFLPRPNFIFFLMKNREKNLRHLTTGASLFNLFLLFFLLLPLILLSVVLELGAVCFGRGGVLQVMAVPQSAVERTFKKLL